MRKIYFLGFIVFSFLAGWTDLSAQTANTYYYTVSSGTTLDPMSGATTIVNSGVDDTPSAIQNIGFTFTYEGVAYTQFSASPDGFIKLGAPAATSQFGNNITSTTNIPKLFPFWDDLATGTTGSVSFVVTGTAPTQILKVQWFVTIPRATGGPANSTMQLWLYETSNIIEFRYGNGVGPSSSASLGINGATATNFISISTPAHTASTTTANNSVTQWPGAGVLYRFFPAATCTAPSGGTTTSSTNNVCAGASFTLLVAGSSFGTGTTYQWESSADDVTWSPVAGATNEALVTSQNAPTYYRRKISCSGSDAYSSSLLVTMNPPVSTLPWSENFDGLGTIGLTSFPTCWFKQNGDWRTANAAHNTYNDPRSGPNYLVNAWSATNEFIWTNGFQLTAGISYDFSFWWAGDGFTGWTGDVFYNTVQNGTGATQMGASFVTAAVAPPNTYSQVKRTFVAPATGVYYFAIRINANGNPWYLGFDDFSLDLTPPCVPPSGLGVSALTTTTATVSWTASVSLPADGYEWEVRTSGTGGSGAVGLAASGTAAAGVTTANATGLTANTDYTLYVRSVCAAGSLYSPWEGPFNFRTPCNAINTFPYTETFEAASATRPCWSPTIVSGSVNWTYGAGAGNGGNITSAHGGTVNARHFGNNTGSVARLVSPALDFSAMPVQGAQVTFWYANQNWLGDQNELRVYYKTSAAGAWTLIPGAVYTSNVGVWTEVELMLPSSSGPADYYIAFEGIELFGWGVALDDVTISVAPTCPKPTNVAAQAISPTSVAVSFTSPGAAFVVEYGAPGFVPGTTNVAGGGTVVLGAASPIIVTGLTANTTYDFYVRRICVPGVDYSANVKATTTTLCNAVNIPYLQTFESAAVPGMPTCTSSQDVNGASGSFWFGTGAGSWETYTDNNPLSWVSPNKSLLYYYDFNDLSRPADDWFYIQGLNLTGGTSYRLKFFYKALDGVNYPEKLEVKYGTAAYAANMTTGTLFTNNNISSVYANRFDSVQVDFTPPASGVYYIGFHAMSDADMFGILVDDISVKVAPLVDVGITGLTLPNVNCPTSGVIAQARIRNYNLTPVNFAANPVTVTANITGAATGTLTATLNSGTLAPNATMDFYLNPAFNFTAGGIYNITVATSSPDDPETANDAYTTSVNVNPNPPAPVITPSAPQICEGGQVQLSTQFTTPPPAPVTLPAVSSGAISVVVPDGTAAGTTHTLAVSSVPAGATVTGISVTLNLTHTWISDMVINLKAPNGKILNLFNARGGNGDNLVNTVISSTSTTSLATGTPPFTGTFAADAVSGVGPTGYASDVTSFAGLYAVGNGNWTLAMRDLFGFDVGTLTSWSITITYQMQHPMVTWTPVSGLFTNATATTAYTGTDAPTIYAKPGATTTYTATASTLAGCSASTNVTVTVNPTPVIAIGNIPDTVCTSDQVVPLEVTPVGGSWSGIGVSGTNFIPPATAVGTYTLTYSYTSTAGCPATSTTQIAVKDCPERIIRLSDNALTLFPNPNNGQFNIRINSVLYNYLTMKVYTNSGLLVRTQQLSGLAWGRIVPIDLTNLPGGVYMVKFYYDGGVRTSEKTFKVIIGLP